MKPKDIAKVEPPETPVEGEHTSESPAPETGMSLEEQLAAFWRPKRLNVVKTGIAFCGSGPISKTIENG